MAVELLHHPRRAGGAPGALSRGSGALLGFVDILIEMTGRRGTDDGSRVRRLRAWSRYQSTPRDLLIELTADGTDYLRVAELAESTEDAAAAPLHDGLRLVLEGASTRMTRLEILGQWLPDFRPAPDEGTLCRWLNRAVEKGQVSREGTGRRNDPFRYWLPEREEFMRPEGGSAEALQAWNARCVEEALARLGLTGGAQPSEQTPLSGNEGATGVSAVAAVQTEVMPPEPVPPPGPGPETAASVSPTAEPLPAPAAQPVAPEAPVRLPYPFNMMNPADVPEEVWKQARRAQQKPL
jgi:hypothetical protein